MFFLHPRVSGEDRCKMLILIGLPSEFQLEHTPEHVENAGFPASELHIRLEQELTVLNQRDFDPSLYIPIVY